MEVRCSLGATHLRLALSNARRSSSVHSYVNSAGPAIHMEPSGVGCAPPAEQVWRARPRLRCLSPKGSFPPLCDGSCVIEILPMLLS